MLVYYFCSCCLHQFRDGLNGAVSQWANCALNDDMKWCRYLIIVDSDVSRRWDICYPSKFIVMISQWCVRTLHHLSLHSKNVSGDKAFGNWLNSTLFDVSRLGISDVINQGEKRKWQRWRCFYGCLLLLSMNWLWEAWEELLKCLSEI